MESKSDNANEKAEPPIDDGNSDSSVEDDRKPAAKPSIHTDEQVDEVSKDYRPPNKSDVEDESEPSRKRKRTEEDDESRPLTNPTPELSQCSASAAAVPAVPLNLKWEDMFRKLVAFKEQHGHCLVPNRWKDDPALGSWVATQRRTFKMQAHTNEPSNGRNVDRERRLNELGFTWKTTDPRHVPWDERYEELKAFVAANGHAEVPMRWEENVQLSNWVSKQRQDFKLVKLGKTTRLTPRRKSLLEAVGFAWEIPKKGRKLQCSKPIHVAVSRSASSLPPASPSDEYGATEKSAGVMKRDNEATNQDQGSSIDQAPSTLPGLENAVDARSGSLQLVNETSTEANAPVGAEDSRPGQGSTTHSHGGLSASHIGHAGLAAPPLAVPMAQAPDQVSNLFNLLLGSMQQPQPNLQLGQLIVGGENFGQVSSQDPPTANPPPPAAGDSNLQNPANLVSSLTLQQLQQSLAPLGTLNLAQNQVSQHSGQNFGQPPPLYNLLGSSPMVFNQQAMNLLQVGTLLNTGQNPQQNVTPESQQQQQQNQQGTQPALFLMQIPAALAQHQQQLQLQQQLQGALLLQYLNHVIQQQVMQLLGAHQSQQPGMAPVLVQPVAANGGGAHLASVLSPLGVHNIMGTPQQQQQQQQHIPLQTHLQQMIHQQIAQVLQQQQVQQQQTSSPAQLSMQQEAQPPQQAASVPAPAPDPPQSFNPYDSYDDDDNDDDQDEEENSSEEEEEETPGMAAV